MFKGALIEAIITAHHSIMSKGLLTCVGLHLNSDPLEAPFRVICSFVAKRMPSRGVCNYLIMGQTWLVHVMARYLHASLLLALILLRSPFLGLQLFKNCRS